MLIILSAYTRLFAGEAELELIFETKIPSYNVEDENLEKALENHVKQTLEVNKKLSSLSFKGIIFDDAAACIDQHTALRSAGAGCGDVAIKAPRSPGSGKGQGDQTSGCPLVGQLHARYVLVLTARCAPPFPGTWTPPVKIRAGCMLRAC